MAASKPPVPPAPQPPKEILSLAEMRDQLADYLATVERNTDAVNRWLSANRDSLILFFQQLRRAINRKDEAAAAALVTKMGDRAGFILSLDDFNALAEAAFGKDSPFGKKIAAIPPSMPASLQEPLPELTAAGTAPDLSRISMEKIPEKKAEDDKNWWSSVSSWFSKDAREQAEKAEKENEKRRQMRALKSEILGLQSDRHYYVDSFMDWVADTMEPEAFNENGTAADAAPKMLQYQDPAHIINLALTDYRAAVENRARAVRDAALAYGRIADAIDNQNVTEFSSAIRSSLYPSADTDTGAMLRKALFEDYQSASLTELVLKHIKKRPDQTKLLYLSFAVKPPLAFSDARTPTEIFEKFFALVLDQNDPLWPEMLPPVMQALTKEHGAKEEDFLAGTPNTLQRIADRFENDPFAHKQVLAAVLNGISFKADGIGDDFVDLCNALKQKDAVQLKHALARIEVKYSADKILAFWQFVHPGVSLADSLLHAFPDTKTKAEIIEHSVQSGLLGDLRNNSSLKFKDLFEKDILPVVHEFPVGTARLLIAHVFSAGGLDGLQAELSKPTSSNWLLRIVSDKKLGESQKLEWVAALLEPFASDIVRANILFEAADQMSALGPVEPLSSLEKNLVGDNIRLAEDKILCNLTRIANIWYSADVGMLRYTVQGQSSHTLLDNVTPAMAGEILSLLRRRGDFLPEQNGIFRPENIDAIHHTPKGTTACWHRVPGDIFPDDKTLEKLKKHPAFLHGKNARTGNSSSYNVSGICLVQPMDDGTTLLVDKYGTPHLLEGKITLPATTGGLVQVGEAFFNPANASIIRLNPNNNTFEFRIEGTDFEKNLLTAPAEDFFYTVNAGDAATFARLKDALDKNGDIHAPNGSDLSSLYFNMKALGYLALDTEPSGFYCKRYSASNKPGFIQVQPDMAGEIISGLEKKSGILRMGDILLHEDSIDYAHYIARKNKFQFVMGREVQEISDAGREAPVFLRKLSQNKSFAIPSSLAKGSLSWRSGQEYFPIDILCMDRATLISYSPAQDQTNVVVEGSALPINLDGKEAQDFLEKIEKDGLAGARKATQNLSWTQRLRDTLLSLPPLSVRVPPAETEVSLLTRIRGQAPAAGNVKNKAGKNKKLADSFSTVADLPPPHSQFLYPEWKKTRASAPKKDGEKAIPQKTKPPKNR